MRSPLWLTWMYRGFLKHPHRNRLLAMASNAHLPAATEEKRTYSPSLVCPRMHLRNSLFTVSDAGEILNMNRQVSSFAGGAWMEASVLHVERRAPYGLQAAL